MHGAPRPLWLQHGTLLTLYSGAVNRGAVEGRPRRAVSHGQLAAANDARLSLTDPRFDGVAGALTARVEARPIVVAAPATFGKGGIPALQSPVSQVDELKVIGKVMVCDVGDLQASITLFDEPAQSLRAAAGQ